MMGFGNSRDKGSEGEKIWVRNRIKKESCLRKVLGIGIVRKKLGCEIGFYSSPSSAAIETLPAATSDHDDGETSVFLQLSTISQLWNCPSESLRFICNAVCSNKEGDAYLFLKCSMAKLIWQEPTVSIEKAQIILHTTCRDKDLTN
ncbi:hypothetical protein FRX31_027427 [Thalictrum thalictroides]|uniref:Uncharacterized protein n=1 Tax=Thalictrum thalictroides TaxID=46969 RepID=A0A7J6VE06_THATH|nr:hypothetical protein FRX31_027427 [Thalictrum thalictroides]